MGNLYLIGFMGTGKSTVASELSILLGRRVAEMDALIVEQEGRSIARIFASEGEAAFREKESALLRKLGENGDLIVSCGGGVPLREENRAILKETGTVFLLDASAEELAKRLSADTERPLLAEHRDEQYIAGMLAGRMPAYLAAADHVIDTAGRPPKDIAEEIAILFTKKTL